MSGLAVIAFAGVCCVHVLSVHSSRIDVIGLDGAYTPRDVALGGTMLAHSIDHYNGVNIDEIDGNMTPEKFKRDLGFSLAEWRKDKKRGVWLKLKSPDNIDLINESVKNHGFQFHSVDVDGAVLLSNWLPVGESSSLPIGPSYYAGVGVVCISKDRKKILAVQEKNGWLKGKGYWKIVTGLADANEPIEIAAVRELMEECGVKGTFKRVLALRQGKGVLKKGDLFFVCLVEPESEKLTIQQSEIERACWMDIDEFFAQKWLASRPPYKALNMAILESLQEESSSTAGLLLQRYDDQDQSIFVPPSKSKS